MPRYLKVREVAERLNIGLATAYALIDKGLLVAARFGCAIRVPVEEVERVERQQLGYVPGDRSVDAT